MFTVLIAEKEHIDAIRQENNLFFEPFLENKDLAFCYWNPEGQTLTESVPGLYDAVGRRKEWRAVIINNPSEEFLKARNPFDVVDYSAVNSLDVPNSQPGPEQSLDDWEACLAEYYSEVSKRKEAVYKSALEYPLQKLSTWLCFRPEDYILNEVQEKQDVQDWAMKQLGRDLMKPSARFELLERNRFKTEQRIKEKIRREFVAENYLNIAYPTELQCVSIRTPDNSFFDPDNYWNTRQESEYSSFADRNMYFDKMRFMVFDLLAQTHRNFRTDYIRFLATVLILVSNPIPASALHARRLYNLETETDDTPLCTLITSYNKKLMATSEVIDIEMERIRSEIPGELTDKAAESMFCSPVDVAVVLDESCDFESVYAEKDYGLFFDSPENENHKWNRSYENSKKALTYITKQQMRSVRKSVTYMHVASELEDVNASRLTPLQIDDVREYTDAAEDEMIESIPPDISEMSSYTDRMEENSESIKKVIGRRMTRMTTLIIAALCLGLYLICFLPFLFANNSSMRSTASSVTFTAIMVGALAVVMLVTLFLLRRSVTKAVKDYNNTMHGIMADIRSSLKRFSKYLSASCTVRRGHAVQNYAQKNMDEYTKSLRVRRKHQEDIRRKRAYLVEGYQDYLGDSSFCDDVMSRPYDYDFDQKTEYMYPAPFLAGDSRQIEFICSGNFVTVPSSYVTRMLVRMEEIYDR